MSAPASARAPGPEDAYRLDEQVGFILRQVQQRHALIFAEAFGDDLTPMQWAALAKLAEVGECSQNLLGRLVAMDVATVKGVVERLIRRGLVATRPDAGDRRRLLLSLTGAGRTAYAELAPLARAITDATLAPLPDPERETFVRLLSRLR